MQPVFKFIVQKRVYHLVTLHAAFTRKRCCFNVHGIMGFPTRPGSSVPGMLSGIIRNL